MAFADTPRKRLGIGIIVSHVIGVVVGIVVYATVATPSILAVIVTFAIALAGSLLTDIVVKVPDIPE